MLKWIGAACILAGGALARQYQVSALRRELDTLSALLAALCRMAEEIRMTRTPLPRLLSRLGREGTGPAGRFFSAVAEAALQGENISAVWRRAAGDLPLAEGPRRAVESLSSGLLGDEESVCKAISLACMDLSRALEDLRARRPETEKRATALCLSGAALLVILLI